MARIQSTVTAPPPPPRTAPYLLLITAIFLLFILLYSRPIIQNDGLSYYGLTLSLVQDGDFDLENQREKIPEIRVTVSQKTGKTASYYSCGYALLYAPFLFLADLASRLFPALNEWRPYAQNLRFPIAHGIAILTGSIFYGLGSVIAGFFLMLKRCRIAPAAAAFFTLAVFIGTSLMFYSFTVPSFSHASDAFVVTIAFLFVTAPNTMSLGGIRLRNVLAGFFLALSVLLRNNNIVLVPVLAGALLWVERTNGWKRILLTAVELFLGALPILILHIQFNAEQYGSAVATGYQVATSNRVLKLRLLRFFYILIHPVAGLYIWSPITLLATAGLIWGALKKKPEFIVSFLTIAVVIISIRFMAIVFPGSSFGQRLLTHLYVFWLIGLFGIYSIQKKVAVLLSSIFVVWTFLLMNLYFVLSGSAETRPALTSGGGKNPIQWMKMAAANYSREREAGNVSNLLGFWYDSLGSGPYPTLQQVLFEEKSWEERRKKRRMRDE